MATKRYGGGKPRRLGVVHVIGALVASGAVAGLLAYNFTHHRDANVALARDWKIDGPPCPSLTKAEFTAKGYKAPKSFDYDDLKMARKAGHASCSDIQQGGGNGMFHDQECQFTSPAALIITTKKGEFFYVPEVGQPATVVVHDGTPKCVLGGKFTLKGEG
jgi:hypothetical protein